MKKTLYKVLLPSLESPWQSFKYEIGKKYYCKEFDTDKKRDCSQGYYATEIEGLPYTYRIGRRIFKCEVWGRTVEINQYKRRYSHIKLLEEMSNKYIKEQALKIEDKVGYKLSEVLFPHNPLNRKMKLKAKHKNLLKQWASVWDSVGTSVWDSVRTSVWDSVWASVWASVRTSVWDSVGTSVWASVRTSVWASVRTSVWDSVWDSVWESVRDSVRAYISSLFPNIKNWKYIEHKEGKNPFQPCIDLWYENIVPSFDGKVWRLHSGKNADVIYEIAKNKL